MAKQRSRGSGVDWFCPGAAVVHGAIAAGAQFVLLDAQLADAVTTQAYDGGAIVGVRIWARLNDGALNILNAPDVILMVLPSGLAVPAVLTEANRKAAERYTWALQMFTMSDVGAASGLWEMNLELRSARRFAPGDRLVLVGVNRAVNAFGAGSSTYTLVDSYVRED